jgi:hypothetical protein
MVFIGRISHEEEVAWFLLTCVIKDGEVMNHVDKLGGGLPSIWMHEYIGQSIEIWGIDGWSYDAEFMTSWVDL